MSSIRVGRTAAVVPGTVLALAPVPAQADPALGAIALVAHTTFDAGQDPFESTLPGCGSGMVVTDPGARTQFTPRGGTFVGIKEFTCTGGAGGFDLRLEARFDESGSVGSWVVAGSWGSQTGLKGSGHLIGVPTDDGINDNYTGTVH